MSPEAIIALYGVIGAFVASILGSWLVYRAQRERTKSQNTKDDMDAAQTALEIAKTSSRRQLELQKEVQELRKLVGAPRHFRVTVVFTAGDTSRIEKAEVEEITDLRHILQAQ